MGIYTRFRDIINSNLNDMLDKAEDPVKLIKFMIHEMEDTLIEFKALCASVMADGKKIHRELDDVLNLATKWENRASLAVSKGRDDLAREALEKKRATMEKAESLRYEQTENDTLIEQYQGDIRQLEEKLGGVREKQHILAQRHVHALKKKRAQEEIRQAENLDTIFKFEELENRIERMEAEADLVNYGKKPILEDELDRLVLDDEIEKELQELKRSLSTGRVSDDQF